LVGQERRWMGALFVCRARAAAARAMLMSFVRCGRLPRGTETSASRGEAAGGALRIAASGPSYRLTWTTGWLAGRADSQQRLRMRRPRGFRNARRAKLWPARAPVHGEPQRWPGVDGVERCDERAAHITRFPSAAVDSAVRGLPIGGGRRQRRTRSTIPRTWRNSSSMTAGFSTALARSGQLLRRYLSNR
jgi:hypothetical protein